jgi:hypothetical protein
MVNGRVDVMKKSQKAYMKEVVVTGIKPISSTKFITGKTPITWESQS